MIFTSLIISLLLTCLIEVPLALWQKVPLKLATGVNLLTNPVVVISYYWAKYLGLPLSSIVFVLELLAICVEGYFYKGHHPKPWRLALYLNGFSFTIGVILNLFQKGVFL